MRIGTTIAGALAIALASTSAQAASFSVSAEAAKVTGTTAIFDYKGVETFDSLDNTGVQDFDSTFGLSTVTGEYRDVNVRQADQYGGDAGSNYAVAGLGIQDSYSISFTATGASGINYFGYWLSALDGNNTVRFFNGAQEVFSFAPTNVMNILQGKADYADYFGNPATGENEGEPYVFLNFFYDGGTFDRIVFEQSNGSRAGYESDNHTIGYFIDKGDGTPVPGVPEPATWMMLISGFGMVGGAMRSRRRDLVPAA